MKLHDYITAHLARPFVWGQHDCVLFAAGWVRNLTGSDPLAGLPAWQNARQAVRAIRGAGGLVAALDARFTPIPPKQAMDGDLALYRGCVCLFSGASIVGPNLHGLEFVRRSAAGQAWRVQ